MASSRPPFDLKSLPGFRTTALLCLALLYLPIIVVIIFSFNGGEHVMKWNGFSIRWYLAALNHPEVVSAASNTLIISSIATIVSTVFATAAALGMSRGKTWRGQAAAHMVINLPLMVPEIITAVATLSFFAALAGAFGINLGIGNLILAHTVFCIPFAYMPIRARLEDADLTLETAAADLYATPWRTFRHVTLPQLAPGVASGAALAFIISFDDFTITQLVAGPGQTTLPLYIWGMIKRPLTPEVNAISTLLLSLSILFVATSFLVQKRK